MISDIFLLELKESKINFLTGRIGKRQAAISAADEKGASRITAAGEKLLLEACIELSEKKLGLLPQAQQHAGWKFGCSEFVILCQRRLGKSEISDLPAEAVSFRW